MTCLAELRPSQRDGCRDFSHSSPSPNASPAAPRVNSQRRMSHPVGACPLYFGIGSAVLEHNKHQRRQSLKEKRRKERHTTGDRYERMLDTIILLFRTYNS